MHKPGFSLHLRAEATVLYPVLPTGTHRANTHTGAPTRIPGMQTPYSLFSKPPLTGLSLHAPTVHFLFLASISLAMYKLPSSLFWTLLAVMVGIPRAQTYLAGAQPVISKRYIVFKCKRQKKRQKKKNPHIKTYLLLRFPKPTTARVGQAEVRSQGCQFTSPTWEGGRGPVTRAITLCFPRRT